MTAIFLVTTTAFLRGMKFDPSYYKLIVFAVILSMFSSSAHSSGKHKRLFSNTNEMSVGILGIETELWSNYSFLCLLLYVLHGTKICVTEGATRFVSCVT